jgi:signal recognition particle subunit SRP54
MFEGLQDKLQGVFRRLRNEGRVSEEVLQGALQEIRIALLEADVHFRVVKAFIERIREQALGADVLGSLTPAQQVIKIVREELTTLLGEDGAELSCSSRPAVIVLCGLQGSGKTTTAGKVAKRLLKRGRYPLLVAGDLQRAAAVEQLVQVGDTAGVPVLSPSAEDPVLPLCRRARRESRERGLDTLIVDTAGRLHLDESLMEELAALVAELEADEVLFVADAMTGQDAVKSAGGFSSHIPLTGAILTKLDGDTRGGAALSIRTVTKVPLRFVGVGEKLDDLEIFRPDRLASRILGMGDVLSLIEKAEQGLDSEESQRLAERLARREFTFDDLRSQMRQLRKMGPLSQVLEMLPRGGPLRGIDASSVDEGRLRKVEAIIDSMTPLERSSPRVLNGSRKKRIARGSGTLVQDVNQLIKQYRAMQKMFKGVQGKWLRKALGQR